MNTYKKFSICEYCGKDHDGSFASGRFCCRSCSYGFSTKAKRKEINDIVSKKRSLSKHNDIEKVCNYCNTIFFIQWAYRNQRFCSRMCAIKYKNLNTVVSDITKSRIQFSVKETYKNGKPVYGGRTKWLQYKDIKVQGTYELRACCILDKWKEEGKIKDWEYTKDRVPYIGVDNKPHTYLLDFKVINNDNSFYYVETKGYIHENDELKWQAVRNLGYHLITWFNEDLTDIENKINMVSIA